jgi:hydroxymethylbilane synthase
MGDVDRFGNAFDAETQRSVAFERALQAALGAGCHTATAAHVSGNQLAFFDQRTGFRSLALTPEQFRTPNAAAVALVAEFGLR